MKKIFLMILLICFICVGCSFGSEEDELKIDDPKIDSLKESHDNISEVIAYKITIGGRVCYDVTEYKDNIYNSIINMKATEKHSRFTTDDGLIFRFIMNDSSDISFEFNHGSYVKNAQEMYLLEKTSYEIKYDKEIECE